MVTDRCPYRKAGFEGEAAYFSNAIIRLLQKKGRGKAAADHNDPVRVVRLSPKLYQRMSSLAFLNRCTTKSGEPKSYPLCHPKYGRDIRIRKYRDSGSYIHFDLRPDKRTPLAAEEREYERISLVVKHEPLNKAKSETKKLKNFKKLNRQL
jgi:hypothetical protein